MIKDILKVSFWGALIGGFLFTILTTLIVVVIPPQWLVEALGQEMAFTVAQLAFPPIWGGAIGGLLGLLGCALDGLKRAWRGRSKKKKVVESPE
jgi:hypothetical protein